MCGLACVIWWATPALADEITVWHAWRGAEEAGLQESADRFAERTGHEVALVFVPFGGFDTKVETAIPRGNGPDLFLAGHGGLGKWSSMGLIDPPEAAPDGQLPAAIRAVTRDGRVWGWPLAVKSLLLLYDPTVIAEPPATTDALIAMAREHTGDGRYGLAYQAAEPYFHAPWMHAFGATAWDDAGVTLDGPEHVAALAFTRRLAVDEGIVPPQPTAEVVGRLYGDGLAPMVISGPWFVADLARPVAAAPLPFVSETGQPARPYLTVDTAFRAAGAAHPEAAAELAAFLSGIEGATIRQEVGRQAVSAAGVEPADPLLAVQRDQAADAVPIPTDPEVAQVWEAQAKAIRQVLRGTSPELAAAGSQTQYLVLSRPPPPPARPLPYAVALAVLALGAIAWAFGPLRDAAFRDRIRAHAWDYAWVLPAGVAMTALVVLPFVTGAAVALFAHHRGEWSFVGLRHFVDILSSRDWPITSPMSFWFTLAVTVLWTAANLTLHVALGVALAMLLREPWIRLRSVWRALLILPWAIPNYITALVWKGMFHAQYGAINALIGGLLLRDEPARIDWFASFSTAFAANLATNTWLGFPFMMVVTLGALQSIPRELEEAADLDGAGPWLRFRHVVWPLLRPALLPAVVIGSVWTFNMFNVVYLVSGGEPDGSTEILVSEAYRWAFSRGNRYGYAAAYAVIIFGVLLVYTRAANRVVRRLA